MGLHGVEASGGSWYAITLTRMAQISVVCNIVCAYYVSDTTCSRNNASRSKRRVCSTRRPCRPHTL